MSPFSRKKVYGGETLALLFIEENLKTSEQQAEGISEFLASQLVEAERELQKQEHKLKEYQQQHRGAMPAQLDANLRGCLKSIKQPAV
jgi:hypothetical protein